MPELTIKCGIIKGLLALFFVRTFNEENLPNEEV
ncbi:MAG: hypothetical protein BWY74_03309 [Firmicutes bacterium ADurb.Bin419]|nr:MAG: hypothetical protein BWY74_03309 [Firmicutes bacterium ADurb.Bin419]